MSVGLQNDDEGNTSPFSPNSTPVQPGALTVAIDIKPGSYPNSVNLSSNGKLPVAILGSGSFDASRVDPLTVTLADAPVCLKNNGTPMASLDDVNGDRRKDLVVHVLTSALNLSVTDTVAKLRGRTVDGTDFEGTDTIRVVGR